MLQTDWRRLDDVLDLGPNEPMTDEAIDAMLGYYEARGIVQAGQMARLLGELRELPEGVATRVRADLLIADLLDALTPPERRGRRLREIVRRQDVAPVGGVVAVGAA